MPPRAASGDAAEVGRRVGAQAVTSGPSRRLAAHHRLDYSFTNPWPENEKGTAGNEAGAIRRDPFVPTPQLSDARGYSERLLETCLRASDGKPRHRKGVAGPGPLGDDRAALSPLPPAPFACVLLQFDVSHSRSGN